MSATLRVVLDQAGIRPLTEVGRYGEEVTNALIASAPAGVQVEGLSAALDQESRDRLIARLPGLSELQITQLGLREQRQAWVYSVTSPRLEGFVHASSLLAPLRSHDSGDAVQYVVTVHSTHALSDRSKGKAKWFARALRRAQRYADGVIVPTAAIADELVGEHGFDERRVRAISAAPPLGLQRAPLDAAVRALRLGLPERFIVTASSSRSARGARQLVKTLADARLADVPVVHLGAVEWEDTTLAELIVAAGIAPGRVTVLGDLDDEDLATVYERASVMILPDEDHGFAMPLLSALHWATPVVHRSSPSIDEIAGGATVSVSTAGDDPGAVAEAAAALFTDEGAASRLSLLARDRAKAFDWPTIAGQLWQFHEEL